MTYEPKPVDTKGISLDPALMQLMEFLARNTHEVWASQRIKDGWRFGARRDDAAREHPCLVPYDDLPESEKDYDRQTASEVLKVILKHGYRIVPP